MRTFERTHQWITFRADLQRADHEFWMLVGEAKSKCEHINGAPLTPETAKELLKVYTSKGAHATTSIEGNTLSEEQVRQLLDGDLKLPQSQEYLAQEVKNIIDACNLIAADVKAGDNHDLSPERIKRFNSLVLKDLELDEVTPGKCRTYAVGVPGYLGAPAEDCEYLLERLCEWLGGPDFLVNADDNRHAVFLKTVLKALLAHLYLAWIHPFGDGNGRTARLLEVEILLQSGLASMPASHLLSNHYNKTRSRYYRELDRASKSGGDVTGFLKYAMQGFVDGLAQQLEVIREEHMNQVWRNYVHDKFKGKETPANIRRRRLVLDMPKDMVQRSEITEVSKRVARSYAGRGPRTLARDLNAVVQMGLVLRSGGFHWANRDIIEAFLPVRASCDLPTSPAYPSPVAASRTPE
jgi:Fic family protein